MSMHDEVLAAAKDMLRLDLTAGTSGNVSGRLDDGYFVITPSSVPYDDMTLSDLVVIDSAGEVVEGAQRPSSERAVHLACYHRYAEVQSVIHAHPVYSSMFACARLPIPAVIDEFAVYVGGSVPCTDYAMSGTPNLAENAAASVQDVGTALLANHGTVTVSTSPARALHQLGVVERAAQIVWGAKLLGPLSEIPEETTKLLSAYYTQLRHGVHD
jgi:L-fuculose-phosphate aldolase